MQTIDIIIEMLDSTRALTMYYANMLVNSDTEKVFVCEDKKLNSAKWIIAHLCWTDNFLLLQTHTRDVSVHEPWFDSFGLGTKPEDATYTMTYEMYLELLQKNRAICKEQLKMLSNEQLMEDNLLQMSMGGNKSIKTILYHAIRHEGIHAGHLGWLCKLNGFKTV